MTFTSFTAKSAEHLTLRQHVIICAMQGLLAHYGYATGEKEVTNKAFLYADALLRMFHSEHEIANYKDIHIPNQNIKQTNAKKATKEKSP